MITEHDLQEAIAECKGVRNPNASTCVKLAAFLTIQKEMYGKQDEQVQTPAYSFQSAPYNELVEYESDSEFMQELNGRSINDILPVIDDLMTTLQVINPRLYAGVMRKIAE